MYVHADELKTAKSVTDKHKPLDKLAITPAVKSLSLSVLTEVFFPTTYLLLT